MAVVRDKGVTSALSEMFADSQGDLRERAAFLFADEDGSIRVGEVFLGERGEVLRGADAPKEAIGVIHTHPDLWHGGAPGGPPSGDDVVYSMRFNIHGVVEERDTRWYMEWTDPETGFRVSKTEPGP